MDKKTSIAFDFMVAGFGACGAMFAVIGLVVGGDVTLGVVATVMNGVCFQVSYNRGKRKLAELKV